MKRLVACLVLVACGHSGPKAAKPTPIAAVPDPPEEEAAPQETAKPKPAKAWHAKAALTPLKGSKLKPTIVSFDQKEGGDTIVTSDQLRGAKPGAYHFVIHAGNTCGPEASKVGTPWGDTAGIDLSFVVNKDLIGNLDRLATELSLDGEHSIVGHTLVLHDDKKGKAGKPLACGAIETADEE